jgi:hypothetical protein
MDKDLGVLRKESRNRAFAKGYDVVCTTPSTPNTTVGDADDDDDNNNNNDDNDVNRNATIFGCALGFKRPKWCTLCEARAQFFLSLDCLPK